jgi:hypothetical protein
MPRPFLLPLFTQARSRYVFSQWCALVLSPRFGRVLTASLYVELCSCNLLCQPHSTSGLNLYEYCCQKIRCSMLRASAPIERPVPDLGLAFTNAPTTIDRMTAQTCAVVPAGALRANRVTTPYFALSGAARRGPIHSRSPEVEERYHSLYPPG